MRFQGWLFAGGAVFFALLALVYGLLSKEVVGTTALVLTACLAALVGFYLVFTSGRLADLPEDRSDARQEDADPDYGFFSPHSWWPLVVAGGASVLVLGLAFAVWVVVLGIGILFWGLFGLLFEYYRGDFAS